jgi:hypothetical protein
VFVVAWRWGTDGKQPDRYDLTGAAVVASGVAIMYVVPRQAALCANVSWLLGAWPVAPGGRRDPLDATGPVAVVLVVEPRYSS